MYKKNAIKRHSNPRIKLAANSQMNEENNNNSKLQCVRFSLIFATIIYCLCFPFFVYGLLFIPAALMDGSFLIGLIVTCVYCLITFSFPFCCYFMWCAYKKNECKRALWIALLPLILFFIASLFSFIPMVWSEE